LTIEFLKRVFVGAVVALVLGGCGAVNLAPVTTTPQVQVSFAPSATAAPTHTATPLPIMQPTALPQVTVVVQQPPTAAPTSTRAPSATPAPTLTRTQTPLPSKTSLPTVGVTRATATRVAPQAVAPQTNSQNANSINQMRLDLLAAYNRVRAQNNQPALSMSSLLQQAAQLHAEEQARLNLNGHYGADGSTVMQRVQRVGYHERYVGENWAYVRSVDQAMEMWYTQEIPDGPHLKNILSPLYQEVGFGIVPTADGRAYRIYADFGGR
jgi:uncharacterized protein YkwD